MALLISPLALGVAAKVPLCPSAALFGIPCPGCGLTRATLALVHGDFTAALGFHPLVFLLAPVYLGLLAAVVIGYVRGTPVWATVGAAPGQRRGLLFSRTVTWLVWVLVVLMFGVWILRFFGWFGGPVPVETLRR